MRRYKALLKIQRWFRHWRRMHRATIIQSCFRMHVQFVRFYHMKSAAIFIQAAQRHVWR